MNTVGHLVMIIAIQNVIAQDFALGKCPDFSVIKNFDLEKVSKTSCKTFNIYNLLIFSTRDFGMNMQSISLCLNC